MIENINPVWITAVGTLVMVASSLFMAGVAWSRGKLEGQIVAMREFFSEWRREDQSSRTEFRQAVEKRMDRIEHRLDNSES